MEEKDEIKHIGSWILLFLWKEVRKNKIDKAIL